MSFDFMGTGAVPRLPTENDDKAPLVEKPNTGHSIRSIIPSSLSNRIRQARENEGSREEINHEARPLKEPGKPYDIRSNSLDMSDKIRQQRERYFNSQSPS